MSVILSLKNVETFYGLICALSGVSLEVPEGKIVTILGPNGAGKTTILKTIMGLIEDQPDKGLIEFNGLRLNGRDTEDIARAGIAYVPEGREVFEELSVDENLALGAYPRRDRQGIRQDTELIYDCFPKLRERRRQWAGTLSGGEQQMLAIGRALIARPKLMMLDEPSLGLSPRLVKDIFDIIKTINQNGVTVLLVEQNANMALSIANYGLVLENGRFVLDGTPKELMKDEDIQEFYLGLKAEASVKGFKRYKRKKRWR